MQNLLQVCERIPTIGTQLKILSTVKATMLGAQGKCCVVAFITLMNQLTWMFLPIKCHSISPNMTGVT